MCKALYAVEEAQQMAPHASSECGISRPRVTSRSSTATRNLYRPWTKKVQSLCNTKRSGFRKALLWAAKLKDAITQVELDGTNWEHVGAANTKLYDMLAQVCTGDAVTKVKTAPGEEQGFEAWRRLERMCEPSSRFTRIDRLNLITHTDLTAT